jgi:trehalose 6-phosphate synthase
MAQQSGDKSQPETNSGGASSATDMARQLTTGRKLIVASNRGPLHFVEEPAGRVTHKRDSSRGSEMFEVLSGVPVTWISSAIGAADRKAVETLSDSDGDIRSHTIPAEWTIRLLTPVRRVHHRFYNVICNPLLWFMLHRSWSPTFTPNIGKQEHDAWDRGYRAVNEMFAEQILTAAGGESFALVSRDYQLMLVPGVVRRSNADSVIHHSFETPWPWPSDFGLLPGEWQKQILESLLSADVLSFPSRTDIDAFVACVSNMFRDGIQSTNRELKGNVTGDRVVHLRTSPAAVRGDQFESVLEFPQTQRFFDALNTGEYEHTFVTVDRAEPHKNIVRTINAFREVLVQRPDLVNKIRLLLFLTPGPAHISAYKRLSEEIRRAARRVNEHSGNPNSVRIYEESNFYRAVAALSVYDTLVSVPLVDGVARAPLDGPLVNSKDGGMILSSGSPAAELLGDHVSLVGFNDVAAITDAMLGEIGRSTEQRSHNSSEIRRTVQALDPDGPVRAILNELIQVVPTG